MKIATLILVLTLSLIFFGCSKEDEKIATPQTTAPEEKPIDKPAVVEKLNRSYNKRRKKSQKSPSRPKKRSSK